MKRMIIPIFYIIMIFTTIPVCAMSEIEDDGYEFSAPTYYPSNKTTSIRNERRIDPKAHEESFTAQEDMPDKFGAEQPDFAGEDPRGTTFGDSN